MTLTRRPNEVTPSPQRRLLLSPIVVAAAMLAGCGSPSTNADSAGTGVGVSAAPTTAAPTDDAPAADPGAPPSAEITSGTGDLGTVIVNVPLGVNALDLPAPALPMFAEVTGADELSSTYAGVPGIEAVVGKVAATPLAAGQRLFVYLVAACSTEDLALRLRGGAVQMVVSGTTTLRCEPPPLQMVVWKLSAGEVPADAVPSEAIQK